MSNSQKSLGFTLVELLVVISIIGLLVGLLLPAVNAAREAGRRTKCLNNQRQLGVAVLNFDSARKRLPGWIEHRSDMPALNWLMILFPYLEQNVLWNRWSGGSATLNDIVGIPTLFCPSSSVPVVGGNFCYVANCGKQDYFRPDPPRRCKFIYVWGHVCSPSCPEIDGLVNGPDNGPANAVFFEIHGSSKAQTIEYISRHDGTTLTLMLSENLQTLDSDGTEKMGWAFLHPISGDLSGHVHEDDVGFVFYDDSIYTDAGSPSLKECTIDSSLSPLIQSLRSSLPRDVNYCRDARHPRPWEDGPQGSPWNGHGFFYGNMYARPSSHHPGVVLCLFCDAHGQTISERIDAGLFRDLMKPRSENAGLSKALQ